MWWMCQLTDLVIVSNTSWTVRGIRDWRGTWLPSLVTQAFLAERSLAEESTQASEHAVGLTGRAVSVILHTLSRGTT